MSSTIKLVDETQIIVNDLYSQVDDTYEYTAHCKDYTELATVAAKLTDENMKNVIITDNTGSEITYSNMTCAEPKFFIVSDKPNMEYVIRFRELTEQDQAEEAMREAIQKFDDETASTVKTLYPNYETLIGRTLDKDFKLLYYNVLYKTAQTTIVSEQYKPGDVGTESIYTRLDETHKGTPEDPIPYYGNQILEKGKIYVDEENTLWICTYGSGIAVFDQLINLPTFVTVWHDAEGTPSDPIIYAGGIALELGKYYTQSMLIYECIKATEGPVSEDLATLRDYVKLYNPYEVTDPEPPVPSEDEDGTIEHPYTWNNNMKIYVGTYYTQDGVLYLGTRDSGIELVHDLRDLVGLYVSVVEQEEPTEEV